MHDPFVLAVAQPGDRRSPSSFVLALFLGISSAGCGLETAELRVRDPARIAVERATKSGAMVTVLPSRAPASRSACPGRDSEGFPLLCASGRWLVRGDGTLMAEGTLRREGDLLRLTTTMARDEPCWRRYQTRMCRRMVPVVFVTPWSNVLAVRTRPGALRDEEDWDLP